MLSTRSLDLPPRPKDLKFLDQLTKDFFRFSKRELKLDLFEKPYSNHIVLKNDQIIGFAIWEPTAKGHYIHEIWLMDSQQRLGYGSILLARVEAIIRKQTKTMLIECDIAPTNTRAQNFFKKHGYRQTSSLGFTKTLTQNTD